MDCFHDFCLACDSESTDGPYCSQTCRLADLEKANKSNPNSPISTFSASAYGWTCSSFGSASGFVLAPAYKFPERTSPYQSQPHSSNERRSNNASGSGPQLQQRLTPSSSRTSLSSSHSSQTSADGVSEEAKLALEDYFNCFDQSRAARRRSSVR